MTTLRHLRAVASRTQSTLLSDAAGAAALMVMLVVGLHLPQLI